MSTRTSRLGTLRELAAFGGVCLLVSLSAVVTKETAVRSSLAPLAAVQDRAGADASVRRVDLAPEAMETDAFSGDGMSVGVGSDTTLTQASDIRDPLVTGATEVATPLAEPAEQMTVVEPSRVYAPSTEMRYFNGRLVRPVRSMRMLVTAYSPDAQSCGDSADGITSSIHCVYTNAMKLVAADSDVLPLGSLVSVPGYDAGQIVPVLDRGGAIKGRRLDVLFPTHNAARRWGVKHLDVVVWEYADGLPPTDYRKARDSR